jgi:hypothetical protein
MSWLGGEIFTIHLRDVFVAVDQTDSGHKWPLINDEPWKRAYVVFREGADTQWMPDSSAAAKRANAISNRVRKKMLSFDRRPLGNGRISKGLKNAVRDPSRYIPH